MIGDEWLGIEAGWEEVKNCHWNHFEFLQPLINVNVIFQGTDNRGDAGRP